jgi:hypothetical protein
MLLMNAYARLILHYLCNIFIFHRSYQLQTEMSSYFLLV